MKLEAQGPFVHDPDLEIWKEPGCTHELWRYAWRDYQQGPSASLVEHLRDILDGDTYEA